MTAGSVNIRSVSPDHYIVTGDRYESFYKKKLAHTGRQFLFGTCPTRTGAVVATHKGKLVGFVLFDWTPTFGKAPPTELQTCGTWVHPEYRRHAVALRMWRRMIRATKPTVVRCVTVTRKGHAFARSAQRILAYTIPNLRWKIERC